MIADSPTVPVLSWNVPEDREEVAGYDMVMKANLPIDCDIFVSEGVSISLSS